MKIQVCTHNYIKKHTHTHINVKTLAVCNSKQKKSQEQLGVESIVYCTRAERIHEIVDTGITISAIIYSTFPTPPSFALSFWHLTRKCIFNARLLLLQVFVIVNNSP